VLFRSRPVTTNPLCLLHAAEGCDYSDKSLDLNPVGKGLSICKQSLNLVLIELL
jgi:hypothetical protein